jgi:hypothetical protein
VRERSLFCSCFSSCLSRTETFFTFRETVIRGRATRAKRHSFASDSPSEPILQSQEDFESIFRKCFFANTLELAQAPVTLELLNRGLERIRIRATNHMHQFSTFEELESWHRLNLTSGRGFSERNYLMSFVFEGAVYKYVTKRNGQKKKICLPVFVDIDFCKENLRVLLSKLFKYRRNPAIDRFRQPTYCFLFLFLMWHLLGILTCGTF